MNETRRTDLRNIAIIAHVDHGKTTLVDGLFHQAGVFRTGQQVDDCVMDSDAQERERGITILAKNCAVTWKDVRMNIIDTPGHADFGGEVERVLRMADGVLLLVDAFEGAMPQTRFVLRKALENGLKPIVVVNKVDKDGCRPTEVVDEVFDLMVDLDADDWQLDFPVLFGSGRDGWMSLDVEKKTEDLSELFDAIVEHVPGPSVKPGEPLQLQVANLDHSDFVGRIAIGRIYAGTIKAGDRVSIMKDENAVPKQGRVLQLHTFEGLGRREIESAEAGDVVLVTGLENIDISDTICDLENPQALPPIPIDEPTIRMTFGVTTSPLAGQDGKPLQSRELKARLDKECERNVALRVAETEAAEVYEVAGRGLLHLSVLIENMRREGYELQVGPPRVIIQEDENGNKTEPFETAVVDVPSEYSSRVINLMLERRGEMQSQSQRGDLEHLEFLVPSRGLIGMKTMLLTATRGEATLNTLFHSYAPYGGSFAARRNGVIMSMGPGEAVAFAIWNLQDRGSFFIEVGDAVYEGMVVGESNKEQDLNVNLTKAKQLTNVRSSGADDAIKIVPVTRPTLEEALEYIAPDELVEVTPNHIRIRKALLKEVDRKRQSRQ